MLPMESVKLLVFSGSLAVLFSSLLGVLMLIPLQAHQSKKQSNFNFKHMGAAHLDWIMLGFCQGLAAVLIWAFGLSVELWVVILMVFGGWANPLPYVFRAFGINAFQFSGSLLQRCAAMLGGLSSLAIVVSWAVLLVLALQNW